MSLAYFRPTDVIAMSGRGWFSRLIKFGTLSKISHVGVMRDADTIVESTNLDGFNGVIARPITELRNYKGKLWRLQLHDLAYNHVDKEQFALSLDELVGRRYDLKRALLAGIDWFWLKRFEATYDIEKLFCSEVVAHVYRAHGILSDQVNPSEITPADVVRWPIWAAKERFEFDANGRAQLIS